MKKRTIKLPLLLSLLLVLFLNLQCVQAQDICSQSEEETTEGVAEGEDSIDITYDVGEEGGDLLLDAGDLVGTEAGEGIGEAIGESIGEEIAVELGEAAVGASFSEAIPVIGQIIGIGVALYSLVKLILNLEHAAEIKLEKKEGNIVKGGEFILPLFPEIYVSANDLNGAKDTVSYIIDIQKKIGKNDISKYLEKTGLNKNVDNVRNIRHLSNHISHAFTKYQGYVGGNDQSIVDPLNSRIPFTYKRSIPTIDFLQKKDPITDITTWNVNYKAKWEHHLGVTYNFPSFDSAQKYTLNNNYENESSAPIELWVATKDNQGKYKYLAPIEKGEYHIEGLNNKIRLRIKDLDLTRFYHYSEKLKKDLFVVLKTEHYEEFAHNEQGHRIFPENWNPRVDSPQFEYSSTITNTVFTKNRFDDWEEDFYPNSQGLHPKKVKTPLLSFLIHDYQPRDTKKSIAEKTNLDEQADSNVNAFPSLYNIGTNQFHNAQIPAPEFGKTHMRIDIPVNREWKKIKAIELMVLSSNRNIIINLDDYVEENETLKAKIKTTHYDDSSNSEPLKIKRLLKLLGSEQGKEEEWEIYDFDKTTHFNFLKGDNYFLIENAPIKGGDIINIQTYYEDNSFSKKLAHYVENQNTDLERGYYRIQSDNQQQLSFDYGSEGYFPSLQSNQDDEKVNWLIEKQPDGFFAIQNRKNNLVLGYSRGELGLHEWNPRDKNLKWRLIPIIEEDEDFIKFFNIGNQSYLNYEDDVITSLYKRGGRFFLTKTFEAPEIVSPAPQNIYHAKSSTVLGSNDDKKVVLNSVSEDKEKKQLINVFYAGCLAYMVYNNENKGYLYYNEEELSWDKEKETLWMFIHKNNDYEFSIYNKNFGPISSLEDNSNQLSVGYNYGDDSNSNFSFKNYLFNELQAHYKFEDNADDSSFYQNHGEAINGVKIVNDPERKFVAQFDGIDDYVDTKKNFTPNNYDGNITVACWVKTDSWGKRFARLVSGASFSIARDEEGEGLRIITWDNNNGGQYLKGSNIMDGKWHHVVMVIESGEGNAFTNSLYIDGKLDEKLSFNHPFSEIENNTIIGNWSLGTSERNFKGLLDDVKIWSKALTANEVLNEYDATNLKGSDLILHYNFEGNFRDESSQKHHGTFLTNSYRFNDLPPLKLSKFLRIIGSTDGQPKKYLDTGHNFDPWEFDGMSVAFWFNPAYPQYDEGKFNLVSSQNWELKYDTDLEQIESIASNNLDQSTSKIYSNSQQVKHNVWSHIGLVFDSQTNKHKLYINGEEYQESNSPTNVALNKPTTQSTTGWGGVSKRAVDGNVSGVWGNRSVTHTNRQTNPWWRVDLVNSQEAEKTFDLSKIKVFNRTDCCTGRLTGAKVYAGNIDSTDPADYTLIGTLNSNYEQTFTTTITNVRYVMVYIPGTNKILSLAEVEVYGVESDSPTNVALNKPITQSTTGWGGVSKRAVDGNVSGVWGNRSVTHTNRQTNPWWRVDLVNSQEAEKTFDLSKIKVFNRTDCCTGRLTGAKVYAGNIDSTDPADYTLIGTLNSNYEQTFTTTITNVRYVMVYIPGTNKVLSLAEVEVYGVESDISMDVNNIRTTLIANAGGELDPFWGFLDYFKIWNRALTADEMIKEYNTDRESEIIVVVETTPPADMCDQFGSIKLSLAKEHPDHQYIAYSFNNGKSFKEKIPAKEGSIEYQFQPGKYHIWASWVDDIESKTYLGEFEVSKPLTASDLQKKPIVSTTFNNTRDGFDNGEIIFNYNEPSEGEGKQFKIILENDNDPNYMNINLVEDSSKQFVIKELSPGTYTPTIKWNNDNCEYQLPSITIEPSEASRARYQYQLENIPGIIQAEYYDEGINQLNVPDGKILGVYLDDNQISDDILFRSDDYVDSKLFDDSSIRLVSSIRANEWLTYSVDVLETSTYNIFISGKLIKVNPSDTHFDVKIDLDNDHLGVIRLYPTISKYTYDQRYPLNNFYLKNVPISKGENRVLKLTFLEGGGGTNTLELDYIRFVDATVSQRFELQNANIPGKIYAINYDKGGEGIGYHDDHNRSGNENEFRPEEKVDIFTMQGSNNKVVGGFRQNEWLAYTVNVEESAFYNVHLNAMNGHGNRPIALYVNDVKKGEFTIRLSNIYNDTILSDIYLERGENQKIRIEFLSDQVYNTNFKINYINFSLSDKPAVNVTHTNATDGLDNGKITFTYPIQNSDISFSIDGGNDYTRVPGNSESYSFLNLSAGEYNIWAKWGNNDFLKELGTITISNIDSNISGGLNATYTNNFNTGFSANTPLKKIDPNIDVNLNRNNVTIVWTGYIKAPTSGEYTFYTNTNDDVKLWIDGQLIIDVPKPPNYIGTESEASINMVAGQKVTIKMTLTKKGFYTRAIANLSWKEGVNVPKQTVPSENLFYIDQVTGVVLDIEELNLTTGETSQLNATVLPSDAFDKNLKWESNNSSIVTVDQNGLITANEDGDATITVITNDGSFSDSVLVTVLSPTNLALNKPTTQSTTGWGGASGRAVDGNVSGVWGNRSVTHTNRQTNPWWRVDLVDVHEVERTFDLSKIKVFNRTDCCTGRLTGAKVYAGNIDSTDPADYTLIGTLNSNYEQTFTTTITNVRYVMVYIPGTNKILSLAEVEVYGVENTSTISFSYAKSINSQSINTDIISVVPNPSDGEYYVRYKNMEAGTIQWSLFNTHRGLLVSGEEIKNSKGNPYEFKITLPIGSSSGVYYLIIVDNEGVTHSFKLLKK